MRTGGLAIMLLGTALAAGCGQDDDAPAVRLAISAPTDSAVVRDDSVEVRGRVKPGDATVLVLGKRAAVDGGEFHERVPLHEGSNVIDVGASASGASAAWGAVRVARVVVIRVPDLVGDSRDDAVDRLKGLGLRPQVDQSSGLLDRVLPVDWVVCETRPAAGAEVTKGGRVRVSVSKTC